MQIFSGKIKWFSQEQRHGVLVGIGGDSLFFTCPQAEHGTVSYTEGQLVGYSDLGNGRVGRRAGNVHGLRRRAHERV